MDARSFVQDLTRSEGAKECLAHLEVLAVREPRLDPFPDLPAVLHERLGLLGIEGLYPHQRRALDALDGGDNLIIATGTASGSWLAACVTFQ